MKAAQLAGLSYIATHEEIAWITLITVELGMLELSYESLVKICCQLRFAQICLNTIQEPQSENTLRKKIQGWSRTSIPNQMALSEISVFPRSTAAVAVHCTEAALKLCI